MFKIKTTQSHSASYFSSKIHLFPCTFKDRSLQFLHTFLFPFKSSWKTCRTWLEKLLRTLFHMLLRCCFLLLQLNWVGFLNIKVSLLTFSSFAWVIGNVYTKFNAAVFYKRKRCHPPEHFIRIQLSEILFVNFCWKNSSQILWNTVAITSLQVYEGHVNNNATILLWSVHRWQQVLCLLCDDYQCRYP